MALTEAYLTSTKSLPKFLEAIKSAKAPEKFTMKFLTDLGFKNSSDRLLIGMLKALGFLDENSIPQQRYFDYLDDSQSEKILGQGIEEAYEDLFVLNRRAHSMANSELMGKLKSLTEGKKSEDVIRKMVTTFLALAKEANFSDAKPIIKENDSSESELPSDSQNSLSSSEFENVSNYQPIKTDSVRNLRLIDAVTYRLEIVLPSSRDKAVYDAIFRSLKEHLL